MRKIITLVMTLSMLMTFTPIASADDNSEILVETLLSENIESVTESSSQTRVLYHVTRTEVMGYKYTEENVKIEGKTSEVVTGATREAVSGEVASKVGGLGASIEVKVGGVFESTNGFECTITYTVTTNHLYSFNYPKIYKNTYAICETISDMTPYSVGGPSLQVTSDNNLIESDSSTRRFELLVKSEFYALGDPIRIRIN